MQRLAYTIHQLYANLLERLLAIEASRSTAQLNGSFVTREVKGRLYHYYHFRSLQGPVQQLYLGPDSKEMRRAIGRIREEHKVYLQDVQDREKLCAALIAGGAMSVPAAYARVLHAFADAGLFRSGMVLIGTHAFAAMGNMLGVRWTEFTSTDDIDFAYDSDIDVAFAMPPGDIEEVPTILDSIDAGFLPIPELDSRKPSTSFISKRNKEVKIDFLIPRFRQDQNDIVFLPHINTTASSLNYLDYLLEEKEKTVLLSARGVLVNIPTPSRYALHKLIVSEERRGRSPAKSRKDLAQSAQLAEVLLQDNPGGLRLSWEALSARGKGWVTKAEASLIRMTTINPEIARQLCELLGIKVETPPPAPLPAGSSRRAGRNSLQKPAGKK